VTTDLVYKNYAQTELDRQYDQRTLVPDITDYAARWVEASEEARRNLAVEMDVAYGSDCGQFMDIFGVDGADRPIALFLHGGAWRPVLAKDQSAQAAPAFVGQGALFVAADFCAAPEFTLDEIVAQCADAIAFLYRNADRFGGDRDRMYVIGHSSGAHLAAMLATMDWDAGYGLPADLIKGLVAVSGVYDLEPVRLSARNDYLHLDADASARNSPSERLEFLCAPGVIAWGDGETAEFRRQSRDFARALSINKKLTHAGEISGRNHFDMADELGRADSPLFAAAMQLLGLRPLAKEKTVKS